jgi:hypothetical protein
MVMRKAGLKELCVNSKHVLVGCLVPEPLHDPQHPLKCISDRARIISAPPTSLLRICLVLKRCGGLNLATSEIERQRTYVANLPFLSNEDGVLQVGAAANCS